MPVSFLQGGSWAKELKLNMEHHFNVEEAVKHGVEKAIILNNLRFWLEKNKANEKHIYNDGAVDEYYWTYNSSKAFAAIFPYINDRTIRRYLQEMEEDGIIISGIFNKHKYDQTKWYTMPEYVIALAKMTNGATENGQPIPYNKPDRKLNSDKSEISVSEEKEELYLNFKFPLVDGWEEKSWADSDGNSGVNLIDERGKKIPEKEIKRREQFYRNRTAKPKEVKTHYEDAENFMQAYAKTCKKYTGTEPVFTKRDKDAIAAAIKKYSLEKIAKVGSWYLNSNAPVKDKVNITMVVWSKTLNNYQVETGNNL